MIECFWLEPTGRKVRYASAYHYLGDVYHRVERDFKGDEPPAIEQCDQCSHIFVSGERSTGTTSEYVRRDTGQTFRSIREAGPGAMWDASWYRDLVGGYVPHMPPDGRIVMVTLPNGNDWCIDSRCSNCTLPDDNEHSCWVRTGEPPKLTVGKGGKTCAAGAGSIQSGDYHGFLRDGVFTP